MTHSLESVWEDREERIYPEMFGSEREGIFPLNRAMFKDVFGVKKADPRWLHLGVFAFAPSETRNSWLYVTSGGSNPWDVEPEGYNEEGYSGLGVEFVLETPERENWAIIALQRIFAYHVLCVLGYFGQNSGLAIGHRIPAGGSMDGKRSALKVFAIAEPETYKSVVVLPSGRFELLHCVGITESERNFAKAHGTKVLVQKLRESGAFPITNAKRKSLKV